MSCDDIKEILSTHTKRSIGKGGVIKESPRATYLDNSSRTRTESVNRYVLDPDTGEIENLGIKDKFKGKL